MNTWNHTAKVCNALLPQITIKKTISAYNRLIRLMLKSSEMVRKVREKKKKYLNDCEWKSKSEWNYREEAAKSNPHSHSHSQTHTHKTHTLSLYSHSHKHIAHTAYHVRNGRSFCDCLSNLMFEMNEQKKWKKNHNRSIQRRNKKQLIIQMICIFYVSCVWVCMSTEGLQFSIFCVSFSNAKI